MICLVEYLFNINLDLFGLFDVCMMCFFVVVVLDGVKGEVIVVFLVWVFEGVIVKVVYV